MRLFTSIVFIIMSCLIFGQKIQQPNGPEDSPQNIIYYIPNTFTPNDDEHNQTFGVVFNTEFTPQQFHMTIFNRWGKPIWESYEHTDKWDGTFQGNNVQSGVYTWEINFKLNDEPFQINGYFNLLR